MSYKHCIYCGTSSDAGGLVGTICMSKNNPLPQNTVGDRPHGFPADGWETTPAPSRSETSAGTWDARALELALRDAWRQAPEDSPMAHADWNAVAAFVMRWIAGQAASAHFTLKQVTDAMYASSPEGFDLAKCGLNEHLLVDELNALLRQPVSNVK